MNKENLLGKKFNRLLLVAQVETKFLCRCDCGKEIFVRLTDLFRKDANKATKSCGCAKRDYLKKLRERGFRDKIPFYKKLYSVWFDMRTRCENPNHKSFMRYGGRGIKVCREWNDFQDFYNWALPLYSSGLQLDRIDNDGNYQPSNCRFVDRKTQMENTSRTKFTYQGEKMTYPKVAKAWGVSYRTVTRRLSYRPIEWWFRLWEESGKPVPFQREMGPVPFGIKKGRTLSERNNAHPLQA